MKVIRKTLEPKTVTSFEFDVQGYKFMCKNLTDGDVFVATVADMSDSVKLPQKVCQEIMENEFYTLSYYTLYVMADSGGEVEIQCISY